MADLFRREDIMRLLGKSENLSSSPDHVGKGKSILMIGDSIMRCMYKVCINSSGVETVHMEEACCC